MMRVSIDGPSASGKTTLGRALAERYAIPFLDTGLTYRALAFAVVERGTRPSIGDLADLLKRIEHASYRPWEIGNTEERLLLDGASVGHLIFSERCNGVLPWITDDDEARELILEFHHRITDGTDFVVAGRDVASTLMPDANLHVFLTADFGVRRKRRQDQVRAGGLGTPVVGASSAQDLATREFIENLATSMIVDTTEVRTEDVLTRVVKELDA
jgi:cytidylate kinase